MEQEELLRYALDVLERLSIPYMVVGSVASAAYGEPRLTQDIDIVIAADVSHVRDLAGSFPETEFYFSVEAATDAVRQRRQFNVIHPESGNKLDFMVARTDAWGQAQLSRRRRINLLPGRPAYAAAPEDIIISKMLSYEEGGSEKHLRDITGILKLASGGIDRAYITSWADTLRLSQIWIAVQARADSSDPHGLF